MELTDLGFFSREASDNEFIKYQFKIFRGSLTLYLYILFIGINIYVWEKYNINYTRALDIQMIGTSSYDIFRRVSVFMALWMILCIYVSKTHVTHRDNQLPTSIQQFFRTELAKFLPPVSFLIYLLYLFFPSKLRFNWSGRKMVFKTFRDILLSPF